MANTRNDVMSGDVEVTLKPNTYAKLLSILKRSSVNGHPISPEIKVHCHIPVCIGYGQGTMSCENLTALVSDLQSKEYDFTIYAAPRKKFDHEAEDPYDVWKRENQELLDQIGVKVILESDWRQTSGWKDADKNYLSYKDRNKDVVEKVLLDDVKSYIKRQMTKLQSSTMPNLGEEEIKAHMLGCVVDCLSWMEKETVEAPNSPLNKLNVLVYEHDLTQLMKNAINSAGKIGYILGSLLHVKPEFEARLGLSNAVQNNAGSPLQYAQHLSDDSGLSSYETQALSTIVTAGMQGGLDTLELGKVIAAMVIEFERKKRQEQTQGGEPSPAAHAVSAAPLTGATSAYNTRSQQRHVSPSPVTASVSRGGMFAPVATSIRGPGVLPASSSAAVSSASSPATTGSQNASHPASHMRSTH